MLSRVLSVLLVAAALAAAPAFALTPSGPITISGQTGTVITGLKITSRTGPCVTITNSTSITIQQSEIGPCGTNNSTADSNGIKIIGSTTVNVYDNYIHVENLAPSGCKPCDTHDGALVQGSKYVTIQGNVIAYGETNIIANGAANDHILVIGNFLLNPRGPFPRGSNFQSWGPSRTSPNTNITVSGNYTLSSTDTTQYLYSDGQEDSLSFGFTSGITVQNNWITGGHSKSGSGIQLDDGSGNSNVSGNDLWNTGGGNTIGISDGFNHTINANKSLTLASSPASQSNEPYGPAGLSVWEQYSGQGGSCGNITLSNNVVNAAANNGNNDYFNGGGCGTVTLTNNTFGPAAKAALNPMPTTNPPPPIPPHPVMCVVASPYTTNTSLPTCSSGGAAE